LFIARMQQSRTMRKLWAMKGFDGKHRGKCWSMLSGSAETRSLMDPNFYPSLAFQVAPQAHDIEKDINRTTMHESVFVSGPATLSRMLLGYSVHDGEVGYCQGMNFLAANLLSQMEEEDAYWCMYTMLTAEQYNLRSMFLPDLHGLKLVKYQFHQLISWFLPKLHAHLVAQEVHSDVYTEWFMTLFSSKRFPRQLCLRVWDLLMVQGVKVLHRVGLAVLHTCQPRLLSMEFEEILTFLTRIPADLLEADAIVGIGLVQFKAITHSLLDRLARQFEKAEQKQVEAARPEDDDK